jgi:dihydroflavonol-4-reductase
MVLVTGAAGHLGNTLVRQLLAQGEQVRALIVPGEDVTSLAGLDLERVEGNILDRQSLRVAFENVDSVFHLAGVISILPGRDELMREVNVLGTWNVARAAGECGVRRLVYVSSIHALARPPKGMAIDESVPFDPRNAEGDYDRTKAEASLIVQQEAARGLDAVIVCPTGIIGPFDFRVSEVGRRIRSWLKPGPHILVNGRFDFVDVRDVARGLILARELGRKGESYILGGHLVSLPELLQHVRAASGERISAVTLPFIVALAAAPFASLINRLQGKSPQFTSYSLRTLASNANIDYGKARRELGYRPRPMGESIADTVAWWREHERLAAPRSVSLCPRTAASSARRPRLAVVTGASSGIGAAAARRLAAEGYRVVLVARRQDRLEQLAAEIGASGGVAEVLVQDLARPEGPRAVFDQVMERYGGLDVLINNAGFGWYGWCSDMQLATARDMIQLNNAALTQLIVLFLPVMRRAARGHIINISSVAGSMPSQGVALYSATKSFVDALSTALNRELRGSGVHVSTVRPGPVISEFYRNAERLPMGSLVPAERLAVKPEVVAQAIMGLLKRPRRAVWVPGGLRIMPWVEFAFGWLIDRIGPLLLRRSYGSARLNG